MNAVEIVQGITTEEVSSMKLVIDQVGRRRTALYLSETLEGKLRWDQVLGIDFLVLAGL